MAHETRTKCFWIYRIEVFVALMTMITLGKSLYFSYLRAILTTLEKQFDLTSVQSGFIYTSSDIGYCFTVLIASYIGGRTHLPRFVGVSSLLRAICVLLMLIPYLLYVAPSSKNRYYSSSSSLSTNLSVVEGSDNQHEEERLICAAALTTVDNRTNTTAWPSKEPHFKATDSESSSSTAMTIMVITQMITGAAGAITSPLGLVYINNNSPPSKAALYSSESTVNHRPIAKPIDVCRKTVANKPKPLIAVYEGSLDLFVSGIVFSMWPLGKIFGFLLSAGVTKIYVHPSDDVPFGEKDPRWIGGLRYCWDRPYVGFLKGMPAESDFFSLGAWWIGVFVLAIFQFLPVIPMFMFPKQLNTIRVEEDSSYEKQPLAHKAADKIRRPDLSATFKEKVKFYLKDFLSIFWAMVRNPIFVAMVIANALNAYVISGYGVYIIKYIEAHFNKTASQASFVLAISGAICGSVGMVLGGALTSICKLKARGMAALIIFGSAVPVIFMVMKLWLVCEQQSVYGINFRSGNTTTCADKECLCPPNAYLPVCTNGTNYVTACQAGCSAYNRTAELYEDCSCAETTQATIGLCEIDCEIMFWMFIISLALASFTGTTDVGAKLTLLMRVVGDNERPVALACLFMLTSIIGWAPSTVVYGAVVDNSCLFWKGDGNKKSCAFYDKVDLRQTLHILTGGLQVLSAIVYGIIAVMVVKKFKTRDIDDDADEEEIDEALKLKQLERRLSQSYEPDDTGAY